MLCVVSMVTTIVVGIDIGMDNNDHIIKEYFYVMKKYANEYSMCSCLPSYTLVHLLTKWHHWTPTCFTFCVKMCFTSLGLSHTLNLFLSLHNFLCLNFGHKLKVKIAMQHAIQLTPIIQEHVTYSQVVHVIFYKN
jgi:hypothetical protein